MPGCTDGGVSTSATAEATASKGNPQSPDRGISALLFSCSHETLDVVMPRGNGWSTLREASIHEPRFPMSALHVTHAFVDGNRQAPWIGDGRQPHQTVGASRAWRDVLTRAAKVAPTEATVCLSGDSGTGKEVIARYIHQLSPRRRGAFIAINCAALPEHLFESELFGFERGAFTGAQQTKPGQIELAAGGVLFLDEITEMPLASQAKLL